jgi:bacterioferritin (cytochrome b1)
VAEKQPQADQLAERIVQLGGRPDVSSERLISWTHAEYVEVDSAGRMFAVGLSAERIAIEHYREKTVSLGAENLTNQQVLEMVLALEDAQAERQRVWLVVLGTALLRERLMSRHCPVLHAPNTERSRRIYDLSPLSGVPGMRNV